MKRVLLLLSVLCLVIICKAQQIAVNTVVELTTDLYASTHSRSDGNGGSCAVLKVNFPSVKDISFSGNIIGEVSYIPGEYQVYVPAGVKQIKFNHPTYGEGTVDFADFGIEIQSKTTYRIVVSKTNGETVNYGSLDISSNEDFADIIMDGYYVGQTPILLPKVLMGKHDLIIGKDGFKTKSISANVNKPEVENVIDLQKEVVIVSFQEDATGLFGLKNEETGEVCTPTKFEDASSIQNMNGVVYHCLKEKNGWALYYKDGQYVGQIDDWKDANEPELAGLTPIRLGSKWGFLHHLGGRLNVHCEYDDLYPFDAGIYTYAKKNGKWGIIDIAGNIIIPFEYDYNNEGLWDWPGNGIFYLQKSGKWGCLNSKGDIKVPFTHDSIESVSTAAVEIISDSEEKNVFDENNGNLQGLRVIEKLQKSGQSVVIDDEQNKMGVMGSDGDLLYPIVFDSIRLFAGQYYISELHGFIGVFDNKGNSVSPLKYNFMCVDEHGEPYALQDENGNFIKLSDIIRDATK